MRGGAIEDRFARQRKALECEVEAGADESGSQCEFSHGVPPLLVKASRRDGSIRGGGLYIGDGRARDGVRRAGGGSQNPRLEWARVSRSVLCGGD